MNCDPKSLSDAARCFSSCIPNGEFEAVKIYLICEFANKNVGPVAPAVPGNIDISDASGNGATIITWTNSDVPLTNEIWRSQNGGPFALIGTVAGTTHTFQDNDLMAVNDFWTYKVRACGAVVCSTFSDTASAANGIDQGGGAAVTVSFPDLIQCYGTINLVFMGNLTSISLPKLRNAQTSFLFTDNPLLTTVSLGALVTSGDFEFSNDPALTSMLLPALTTITGGGSIVGSGCTVITTFSAPKLAGSINNLQLDTCPALATITLTHLASTSADFNVSGCSALTSLTTTSLVSVGNNLTLSFIGACPVSFPALTTITGSFDFTSSGIISMAVPLLASCPIIQYAGANSLGALSFPALTGLVNNWSGANCNSLASLNIGGAVSMNADFQHNDCPLLTTVQMPNMTFVDLGFVITFVNCALAVGNSAAGTGIDGVLRRAVVSGLTAADIELTGGTNATPDVTGQADKTTLIAAGCTVNTN